MKATDFDFHLPEYLIASRPAVPRDSCRLLILHRDGSMEHRRFSDITEYLAEGDLLLLNDTKVFPARLLGTKQTGGKLEVLLVEETEPDVWKVLTREKYTGKVFLSGRLLGEMSPLGHLRVEHGADFRKTLWEAGLMPLPPYIKRKPEEADKEWYQTVYAEREGSIAAPTAGLHFTDALLEALGKKGVLVRFLTLHVGTGTFRPIKCDSLEKHTMDEESFELHRDLLQTIRMTKEFGGRLIAVGTTTSRAIEGFFSGKYREDPAGMNGSIRGRTNIFIYPGYRFRAVDSLVTNFHLPGSTPLMLASALRGKGRLLEAYGRAVSMKYRFFSYGDAMLIL
jgi:S-adenosylmethionine:tRNA ribosyltransferase-isomerase